MATFIVAKDWKVFSDITELFIMIPVLLNLKGNLEMGLAARLSTAANKEEEKGGSLRLTDGSVRGNVLLVQFQALLSGLLVGLLSCVLGLLSHGKFKSPAEIIMILACSMTTAFLSSALTGLLLAVIIVKSRQAKINPDNISTPLANCLGDLSTMCMLALIARFLYSFNSNLLNGLLLLGSLLFTIVWTLALIRIDQVKHLILEGWPPVIAAIGISSIAGLAFERFVRSFNGLGLVLTVVNGVCGNTSSILAARIATNLQLELSYEDDGQEESNDRKRYRSAKRTLLLMCTPIHLIFITLLQVTELGHVKITPIYVLCHLFTANLHLLIILAWLVPNLMRLLWSRKIDPDTYTMPLVAACSDLSGTLLFISMFSLLSFFGDT